MKKISFREFALVGSFVILLAWATTATVFILHGNPIPFPDRGHRAFGVPDQRAVEAVTEIMEKYGVKQRFTFECGPIRQRLFWDSETVIVMAKQDTGLPLNYLSLPTDRPKEAAYENKRALESNGFSAVVHENVVPELGDRLVLLESNAFLGWVMVFRLPLLHPDMARPKVLSPEELEKARQISRK